MEEVNAFKDVVMIMYFKYVMLKPDWLKDISIIHPAINITLLSLLM
jgi:hypothetical protein